MVIRELVTKLGFKTDTKKMRAYETKMSGLNKKLTHLSGKWAAFNQRLGKTPFGKLANDIPGVSNLMGKLSTKAGMVGLALGGIVIAAIAVTKAISFMTKKYLAFEVEMKGVERVTLATAEDMKKLEEAALSAGEASIFSTADAARAQKFLAQAGLSTAQIIGALPASLNLAAAGALDLATATDIATDIMAANKLEVKDLTMLNDALIVSSNSATTSVSGLGEGMRTLGASGKLAGLDIHTLTSAMAIIQGTGSKGSLAGTLLRNAFVDLRNPSKKLSSAIKAVNIDLNNYVDTQTGTIKDLPGFINKLRTLSKVDLNTFFKGFGAASRGKRAIEALVISGEKFNQTLEKVRNSAGSAAKASAIAFKGLDGALKQFSSRIDASSVKFIKGTGLNKVFEDIVRMVSDILPPLIDMLAVFFKPFVKAIQAILFPFRLIVKIIGGIIKLWSKFGGTVMDGVLSPLDEILKFFDKIINGVDLFFIALNDLKEGPLSGVFDFISNIFSIFRSLIQLIGLSISWLIEKVAGAVLWVYDKVKPIIDLLLLPIKKVFSFLSMVISRIAKFLGKTVKALKEPNLTTKSINRRTTTRTNNININAPVSVRGGDTAKATGRNVKDAMSSMFAIQLQKLVIESGGI